MSSIPALPRTPFLRLRPRRALARPTNCVDVPATFTEAQAALVLALQQMPGLNRKQPAVSKRFSTAQAECVEALLTLDLRDLRAMLADGTQPCELRNQLRHGDSNSINARMTQVLMAIESRPSRSTASIRAR